MELDGALHVETNKSIKKKKTQQRCLLPEVMTTVPVRCSSGDALRSFIALIRHIVENKLVASA